VEEGTKKKQLKRKVREEGGERILRKETPATL